MPNTQIVGILNITPDSFSDGGNYTLKETALNHAKQLIEQGADILDIGAESTRPGATPLTATQEWQRLEPLLPPIITLVHQHTRQVSLDTRHPATAEKALRLGVDWINDVSGFASPEMINAVLSSNCKCVFMHNLGVPADKTIIMPEDKDCIPSILQWAQERKTTFMNAGIDHSRLIFDPGIGFGKNAQQSRHIIDNIQAFHGLDLPLYIGHSRKSFLGVGTLEERDEATAEIAMQLAEAGVEYIRVHDVKGVVGKVLVKSGGA